MSNKLIKDKLDNDDDEKDALSHRKSSLLNNNSRTYDFKYLLTTILILLIAFVLVFVNNSTFNSFLNTPTLFKQDLHTSEQTQMAQSAQDNEAWKHAKTIYEFQAPDIDGKTVDLSKYK